MRQLFPAKVTMLEGQDPILFAPENQNWLGNLVQVIPDGRQDLFPGAAKVYDQSQNSQEKFLESGPGKEIIIKFYEIPGYQALVADSQFKKEPQSYTAGTGDDLSHQRERH
jgi:hypothetical protein